MLSDLAFALAAHGESVAVITSRQRYDAPNVELPARETVAGVKIFRIWTTRFGRDNLAGRAIDYLTFYLFAAWRLWRLARAGDVVIAKTDPPMLSLIAAPVARWRGARLVNWLQDLFPEVAEAMASRGGAIPRVAFAALRWLRDRSLKGAALNVAVGQHMAEKLIATRLDWRRVRVVPNWADTALIRPVDHAHNGLRTEWGLEGRFVVGYSGNLGRAHEYETLLHAMDAIERKGNPGAQITWLFIGGGALYARLQAEVSKRGLTSITFKPYQPREHLGAVLSVADVHLVSLRPELEGFIVPSKFYGIAAAARPAIFVGNREGEIPQLIARYECGRVIEDGDGKVLAQTILDFAGAPEVCREMGGRARRAAESEFDRVVAVSRWQALFAEVSDVSSVYAPADDFLAEPLSSARNAR